MSKKKKNGNQEKTLTVLVLVTAILNLIKAIIDLIEKFLEWEVGGKPPYLARRHNNIKAKKCQYKIFWKELQKW